eukprot:9864728-Karenia_brevis.AAC.1
MWKEACEAAKTKQFARRMAAGSHDSRASEEADPNQGAVKTEASNDAESATNASTNAPGSASTQVKQETHTGSVFETYGRSSNPKAETYD